MKKYNNKTVKKFLRLQVKQKLIEKQLLEIRSLFIQNEGGISKDYLITVSKGLREIVAGKDIFASKLGESFLKDNELLKTVEVNQVSVKERVTV